MNYTNREVVRRLKQYDMFLNSLNLTTDEVQKERICDQLDKIEKQILLDTNTEYEEEYLRLEGKESKLLEDEKKRLRDIISLITERREYLNKRRDKHEQVTGSLVELTTFNGEDKLSFYKRKLKAIENYESNKQEKENIIKEMKTLDVKISEASRNVKANMRLNDMLENKMIGLVGKALDKLDLYSLTMEKDKILSKHSSLSYARKMALDNLASANEIHDNSMIAECNDMLSEITEEFLKYDEKVNIIEFIELYDKPVVGYDELLKKREKMDIILKNISGSKLYDEISDEIFKEYNTIKLEKQDIKTHDVLKTERENKTKRLYQIDEENNSKEFKELLDDLIKNENKYREEKIVLARKQESMERDKKIKEEQKIEAARVRRQKLIEEAKLKEQTARAEKLKELQKKTVIIPTAEEQLKKDRKKEEKKDSIDIVLEEEIATNDIKGEKVKEEKIKNPLENKTLDEVLAFDTFDTDELFENTKIVPNKVNDENTNESLLKEVETEESKEKTIKVETPKWESVEEESEPKAIELPKEEKLDFPEAPFWTPVVDDIPKQNPQIEKIKESNNKTFENNSIYDVLENNDNIIWKTTEEKPKLNEIPVIKNNGAEIPKREEKEGDILWKETL